MPFSQQMQRAVLAIRDVIASGGRVLRSSRGFWARFGFPDITTRQEAIAAARDLYSLGNEIEAGSIRGTIADALSSAGFPTTDISGGLTGGTQAAVYGRAEFINQLGETVYRSFRINLSFDSSIDQIEEAINDMLDDLGESYGLEGGVIAAGSLAVY